LKVLHVLGELRASGAEVMLMSAVPLMGEAGITTIVLSTGGLQGQYAQNYEHAGVKVLHLPFAKSPAFAMAYFRLLRRERPEVVHIHTERANAALAVLSCLAGVRRVVRTIHNVFTFRGRLRMIRIVERGLLRRLGVRHISIGPSVEQNELVELRNPTTRIDNWLGAKFRPPSFEERQATRERLEFADDALAITSIGNCSRVKNHAAILSALPAVARATQRPTVYLHVGSGDEEVSERELARELPSSVEVRFLGTITDVRPLLWASDIFCMPSQYEGLSVAALEALACGVPAVLSDVPGLKDTYAASPSVLFVPPTAEGVFEGIHALLARPPERVRVAAMDAAMAVRAKHAVSSQVSKLIAVYHDD